MIRPNTTSTPAAISTKSPAPFSTSTVKLPNVATPKPAAIGSGYTNSGFDAGYAWGEDNEICDTSYSNGNSASFDEGVQTWASDNCTDAEE